MIALTIAKAIGAALLIGFVVIALHRCAGPRIEGQ